MKPQLTDADTCVLSHCRVNRGELPARTAPASGRRRSAFPLRRSARTTLRTGLRVESISWFTIFPSTLSLEIKLSVVFTFFFFFFFFFWGRRDCGLVWGQELPWGSPRNLIIRLMHYNSCALIRTDSWFCIIKSQLFSSGPVLTCVRAAGRSRPAALLTQLNAAVVSEHRESHSGSIFRRLILDLYVMCVAKQGNRSHSVP